MNWQCGETFFSHCKSLALTGNFMLPNLRDIGICAVILGVQGNLTGEING